MPSEIFFIVVLVVELIVFMLYSSGEKQKYDELETVFNNLSSCYKGVLASRESDNDYIRSSLMSIFNEIGEQEESIK